MNAREVALAVVRDVFPAPGEAMARGAQEALDYRARNASLSARDRAFATELAYGAIKMRRALDWYLASFIGDRAHPLPPAMREILRLATYELVYTKADVHATVFEFVNLAKKYGHRGLANLVNAVLRSFLRERPLDPTPEDFESRADYVANRYSLPTWLVRQWEASFGPDLEAVCAAVNEPARTAIVVNVARTSRAAIAEQFRAEGVGSRPSEVVPESLIVDEAAAVHRLEPAAAAGWWIQSESSAMPVDVLNPQPGETVLDLCSGRGNKALHIGVRLAGDGTLLCVERDARKAVILERRLAAAGILAEIVVGDAGAELWAPARKFDRVLLDAPCSGTGVVGRHPEARWKKEGTDGERLAFTQRQLLEQAARYVQAGGTLVYAVCSTDPRETTEVIEFVLERENFERGLIRAEYEPFLTGAGDVLVPPGVDGRDGFFIARLDRRS